MRFCSTIQSSLFLLLGALIPSFGHCQIVLSEIMFDPSGSEYYTEFVEIYNCSITDTVDLTGWAISDSAEKDFLLPEAEDMRLAPGCFGLILDSGYRDNSQIYDDLIPESAVILIIDDSAFGSQGLSNSVAEPILLINSAGDTVAVYRYSLDNRPGFSDEKINLSGDDAPENWANSQTENGTPGAPNSVRQVAFDVRVALRLSPPVIGPDQNFSLLISVTNLGTDNCAGFEVLVFEDENSDSILTEEEQIGQPYFPQEMLASGDSLLFSVDMEARGSGLHLFYARVQLDQDQNISNNSARVEARIGFTRHAVVINEIMFRPSASTAEWIELFNPGDAPINVQLWKVSDSHLDAPVEISPADIMIDSKQYLIISEDSTIFTLFPEISCPVITPADGFPALNNSGDWIVLTDLAQNVIDDVNYSASWGSESGFSLERIRSQGQSSDPLNWGLCQDETGATPGAKNSLSPMDYDLNIHLWLAPHSIDSLSFFVSVHNVGLKPISEFTYLLYLDQNVDSSGQTGELLTTQLFENHTIESGDSISFYHSLPAPDPGFIQIIALLICNTDEELVNNFTILPFRAPIRRGQIVLNEVMFHPASGQPEWFEIFNTDSIAINLNELKFSHGGASKRYLSCTEDIFIQPHGFAILSENDVLLSAFPTIACPILVPTTWPDLTNSSDQIHLFDASDHAIDSMAYSFGQESKPGISLERLDPADSFADSAQWAFCIDFAGGTPGMRNSVAPLEVDAGVTDIAFSPTHPGPGDEIDISIQVTNVGITEIATIQLNCFIDFNGDGVQQSDERIGETITVEQRLERGESAVASIRYIPLQPGQITICARLSLVSDMNPSNDFRSARLSIGFAAQSLVINEIMYAPLSGDPEWIEIFNPHTEAVDIQHWTWADSDSADRIVLTLSPTTIQPSSFLILADDSSLATELEFSAATLIAPESWPGLNNDEDAIYIFDANGNVIDEVAYADSWGGGSGTSLERINPRRPSGDVANWSSSVSGSGSTPGGVNSIFADELPRRAELMIAPNPFSPDYDLRDDDAVISIQLPFNLAHINLKIYDIRGRLVRFLANNQPAGIHTVIKWDGLNDEGFMCRMGIYIVFLEALHSEKGLVETIKKTVVLAGQLSDR
ncbi:MAG: lamin tail domain-containing protein [Candidatus Zhuqueibacterota bacterium]